MENLKATWQHLLSPARFDGQSLTHPKDKSTTRSAFHIDYDRVIFSRAFRRLARKTQVHPLAVNDHTHNRLTHSLEVASVGRNLGTQIGEWLHIKDHLPDSYHPNDVGTIVQVACLAHDLGNPPFGHTGEEAIREWFKKDNHAHYLQTLSEPEKSDICTYEGNAHSLRRVATLEMYDTGGMRLTMASLGTLLKYPWTSNHAKNGKFNVYQSELKLMKLLAQTLGLKPLGENRWQRHPLSYLMEISDDICYAILDLEDAVEMGILGVDEFCQVLMPLSKSKTSTNLSMIRSMAINNAVKDAAVAFQKHHNTLLNGDFTNDLLTACTANTKETLAHAKALAKDKIYTHPNKLATEIGSFGCLFMLLDTFIPAVYRHYLGDPSQKDTLALKIMDIHLDQASLYQGYMQVLDYVGGLTDNKAAKLAKELSGFGIV